MTLSCSKIVYRKDHVTVSKSYSNDCTCSKTEKNIAINDKSPLLQDPWPCIQLLCAEGHAPCQ